MQANALDDEAGGANGSIALDHAMVLCTEAVTRRLQFPPHKPGIIEVSYPLIFQPRS